MTLEIYAQTRAMSLFIFFSLSLSPSLCFGRFLLKFIQRHCKHRTSIKTLQKHLWQNYTKRKSGGREGGREEREKQSIVKKYLCDELPTRHCLSVYLTVRRPSIFSRIHFPLSVFHFHEVLVSPC